ncbi:hypothetical protein HAZT_HAZT009773 [Hyalella azteca]|uniref:MBD domain-containing protein n=1 Tax=Hyalella azteca TaxID=294128 RepID=A0A6A0GSK1_HYAAZ|nr:hypothetical protein HAZT_HAZT009773 [Hyalella azteca]
MNMMPGSPMNMPPNNVNMVPNNAMNMMANGVPNMAANAAMSMASNGQMNMGPNAPMNMMPGNAMYMMPNNVGSLSNNAMSMMGSHSMNRPVKKCVSMTQYHAASMGSNIPANNHGPNAANVSPSAINFHSNNSACINSGINVVSKNALNQSSSSVMNVTPSVGTSVPSSNSMNIPGQTAANGMNSSSMSMTGHGGVNMPGINGMNVQCNSGMNMPNHNGMNTPSHNGMTLPNNNSVNMLNSNGMIMHNNSMNMSNTNGMIMPSNSGMNMPNTNGMNMTTNNGMNMINNNGMNIPSNSVMNMPSNNGMNMPSNNGMNMPSNNGMNMMSNNGMNMMSNNGLNMMTHNGMNMPNNNDISLSSNNGMNMLSNNGMNMPGNGGMNMSASGGVGLCHARMMCGPRLPGPMVGASGLGSMGCVGSLGDGSCSAYGGPVMSPPALRAPGAIAGTGCSPAGAPLMHCMDGRSMHYKSNGVMMSRDAYMDVCGANNCGQSNQHYCQQPMGYQHHMGHYAHHKTTPQQFMCHQQHMQHPNAFMCNSMITPARPQMNVSKAMYVNGGVAPTNNSLMHSTPSHPGALLVVVPFGWRRIISANRVVYVSPSGNELSSALAVSQYLTTEGTCKCGLQCPLKVASVFCFDPNVPDRPTLPAELNNKDVLQSCTHRRKLADAFTKHMTATRQQHLGLQSRPCHEAVCHYNHMSPAGPHTQLIPHAGYPPHATPPLHHQMSANSCLPHHHQLPQPAASHKQTDPCPKTEPGPASCDSSSDATLTQAIQPKTGGVTPTHTHSSSPCRLCHPWLVLHQSCHAQRQQPSLLLLLVRLEDLLMQPLEPQMMMQPQEMIHHQAFPIQQQMMLQSPHFEQRGFAAQHQMQDPCRPGFMRGGMMQPMVPRGAMMRGPFPAPAGGYRMPMGPRMGSQWPPEDDKSGGIKRRRGGGAAISRARKRPKVADEGSPIVVPSFLEDPNAYLAQQTAMLNSTMAGGPARLETSGVSDDVTSTRKTFSPKATNIPDKSNEGVKACISFDSSHSTSDCKTQQWRSNVGSTGQASQALGTEMLAIRSRVLRASPTSNFDVDKDDTQDTDCGDDDASNDTTSDPDDGCSNSAEALSASSLATLKNQATKPNNHTSIDPDVLNTPLRGRLATRHSSFISNAHESDSSNKPLSPGPISSTCSQTPLEMVQNIVSSIPLPPVSHVCSSASSFPSDGVSCSLPSSASVTASTARHTPPFLPQAVGGSQQSTLATSLHHRIYDGVVRSGILVQQPTVAVSSSSVVVVSGPKHASHVASLSALQPVQPLVHLVNPFPSATPLIIQQTAGIGGLGSISAICSNAQILPTSCTAFVTTQQATPVSSGTRTPLPLSSSSPQLQVAHVVTTDGRLDSTGSPSGSSTVSTPHSTPPDPAPSPQPPRKRRRRRNSSSSQALPNILPTLIVNSRPQQQQLVVTGSQARFTSQASSAGTHQVITNVSAGSMIAASAPTAINVVQMVGPSMAGTLTAGTLQPPAILVGSSASPGVILPSDATFLSTDPNTCLTYPVQIVGVTASPAQQMVAVRSQGASTEGGKIVTCLSSPPAVSNNSGGVHLYAHNANQAVMSARSLGAPAAVLAPDYLTYQQHVFMQQPLVAKTSIAGLSPQGTVISAGQQHLLSSSSNCSDAGHSSVSISTQTLQNESENCDVSSTGDFQLCRVSCASSVSPNSPSHQSAEVTTTRLDEEPQRVSSTPHKPPSASDCLSSSATPPHQASGELSPIQQ